MPDGIAAGAVIPAAMPESAAKVIAAAGLTPEQVYTALGTGPAQASANVDVAILLDLAFDESAKVVMRDALRWALRLGHNYIGTEHLLLAALFAGGPVTDAFGGLGLSPHRAEQLIDDEIAAFQARRG